MSFMHGIKLSPEFCAAAIGAAAFAVPAAISYKTGTGEPFSVGIISLASSIFVYGNRDNIARFATKVKNGIKSLGL